MKIVRMLIIVFAVGLSVILISFLGTQNKIENSLIEICDQASERYDCLPRKALVLQLSDTAITVSQMNQTIWAIGKLKIESTVPQLERMHFKASSVDYQFSSCNYEIEKALGYLKYKKRDLMSFEHLYN